MKSTITLSLIFTSIALLSGCCGPRNPQEHVPQPPGELGALRSECTTFTITPKFNSDSDKRVQNHYTASKSIITTTGKDKIENHSNSPTLVSPMYTVMDEKNLKPVEYKAIHRGEKIITTKSIKVIPVKTEAGFSYHIEISESETPRTDS